MIECVSSIAEVVVYPGRAQITRRGQVELPADATVVQLPDLPLSLLPESVRVSGQGTARVRLLGVEVEKARYAVPPEEDLAGLDAQIEQLEDEDRVLADQLAALSQRLATLDSLAQAAPERLVRGFTWGRLDLDRVQSLLGFVHETRSAIQEEIRQLEMERRELGREMERLRRLRQDRQQTRRPDRYTVNVPLEVQEAGTFELELTYVCQEATWKPLYDLRLVEDAEGAPRVAVSQLAEVSQRSGEDWTGVRLAVSTARPALAARLPELKPWHINLYQPMPAPTARRVGRVQAAAVPVAPAAEDGQPELTLAAEPVVEKRAKETVEADVAVAEVSQEGPAVVFIAPGRASIPTDGSAHKVFLGTRDLSAELDWVTAPKLEAHVYRRARVKNVTSSVLLPGQASLFHGDTFIGSTTVPETPVEANLEVYLGVDEQVKVEREQVERTVDKSGVLDKVRRILYAYRIVLQNFHSERIALTVLDQIPVSRHENLKVKLVRSEPEVEPGEMGELRWELGLAAGEERAFTFAFQVEMPLDREAVGLP